MPQDADAPPAEHDQSADPGHVPVLLEETLERLDPKPGETAVDATAGRGGHASEIAKRLGHTGTLILADLDPGNLQYAHNRVLTLPDPPHTVTHHGPFHRLPKFLNDNDLRTDTILADLGFSSNQMEDPQRGLSFSRDGPLDMRFDTNATITAQHIINTFPEDAIAEYLRQLGEEPAARRIARKLVQERQIAPIETTGRLAEIVRSVVPRQRGDKIDPATRTFQALRIAVNDEIGILETFLTELESSVRRSRQDPSKPAWLDDGARVGFITFHSLEDRLVKRSFRALQQAGLAQPATKKPVTPSPQELDRNRRARSAKLRVCTISTGTGSTGTGSTGTGSTNTGSTNTG